MSARKRCNNTTLKPSTSSLNIKKSSTNLSDEGTLPVDYSQSQRAMQHKLDMAYNRLLQTYAYKHLIESKNEELLQKYEEALINVTEKYESTLSEKQTKKEYLEDLSIVFECDSKFKLLEKSLQDITNFIDEKEVLTTAKQVNNNLKLICDSLKTVNLKFESSEENYTKLENLLKDISDVLKEINEDNNEEFIALIDNLLKAKDLILILKENHKRLKQYQKKVNKLVLKTSSMELSNSSK